MATQDKKSLSSQKSCANWKRRPWKAVILIIGGIQAEARWLPVDKLLRKFMQHIGSMQCCVECLSVQTEPMPSLFGAGTHKLNKQMSNYMNFI